jgi:TatD DNase family protein
VLVSIESLRQLLILREAARMVSDEHLLIETDSVCMAPAPHHGKMNQPAWVNHVAEVSGAAAGHIASCQRTTSADFLKSARHR